MTKARILDQDGWVDATITAETDTNVHLQTEDGTVLRRAKSTEGRTWERVEAENEPAPTERKYHAPNCWACKGYRQEGYAPNPDDLKLPGIVFGTCIADPENPMVLKGVSMDICVDFPRMGSKRDPHKPWRQDAYHSYGDSRPLSC